MTYKYHRTPSTWPELTYGRPATRTCFAFYHSIFFSFMHLKRLLTLRPLERRQTKQKRKKREKKAQILLNSVSWLRSGYAQYVVFICLFPFQYHMKIRNCHSYSGKYGNALNTSFIYKKKRGEWNQVAFILQNSFPHICVEAFLRYSFLGRKQD